MRGMLQAALVKRESTTKVSQYASQRATILIYSAQVAIPDFGKDGFDLGVMPCEEKLVLILYGQPHPVKLMADLAFCREQIASEVKRK